MLISVLSENLNKKISLLNHAVSSRAQLPILYNFLLQAKGGKLTISATDLEIGIITSIPASVEKEGEITIPAKNFADLVSNIGSQKITLETEGNVLNLKSDKVKASFPTIAPEEFPKLYEKKGDLFLKLERKDVDKYITRISFAAATDSPRPALMGVLLESEKQSLVFVATDQYRLSYQKTSLKPVKELAEPLVIPSKLIKETMFLKEDAPLEFYISKESNQVVITQLDTTIVGRLIDAQYPPYQKIIPVDSSTKTSFSREDLLNAIRICSVFARETANVVKLSLQKGKIVVSANSPSVGEDSAELDAKTIGEDNEIAFNAKYLIDLLSTLSEDELSFEMTGPLNAGVFRIVGDNNFLHLIMPIRLQE